VRIGQDAVLVRNKAIHIALGVRADGTKEILGLWIEQNEGAKFWLRVMNELKNRGTEDILIAVVDGLKGFPEAIRAVFPEATVQTCIVHLLRYSLAFVSFKDRKDVATAMKDIYRAKDDVAACAALDAFEAGAGLPWQTPHQLLSRRDRLLFKPGDVLPHRLEVSHAQFRKRVRERRLRPHHSIGVDVDGCDRS
jgi:putative transposase